MEIPEKIRAMMQRATQKLRTGNPVDATASIQRTLKNTLSPNQLLDQTAMPRFVRERQADSPFSPHLRTPDGLAGFVPELLAGLGIATPQGGAGFAGPAFKPQRRQQDTQTHTDTESGGQFVGKSYSNHAGTRSYKLYIPGSYHGQALPLVVMLHGCTQNPDDFAAGTGMNALAENEQCFVAYPYQAQSANVSKCWNWFSAVDQEREKGEPSIIAGITREIIQDYAVDQHRVYIAGLSAGGAMAVIMGTSYPDLYAAVGVHSGLPFASAHDLPSALSAMKGGMGGATAKQRQKGIPVIVFHGDQDKTVHPSNGDQVMAQSIRSSGARTSSASVEVQQGNVPNGHAYTRTIHHDEIGRAIAEQWLVHGAGHAWSGGSNRGSYTDANGPDATREMMRFFSTHSHPGKNKEAPI